MAERDPRRPGGPSEASREPKRPGEGERAATPASTEAGELGAWGGGGPPAPGRGQPGLSWSNLADLDEGGAAEPRTGVGPVEGTGGLLGVDSGLLRVIEDAAPAPLPAEGALPMGLELEAPGPSRPAPATPSIARRPAPPPDPEWTPDDADEPAGGGAAEGANWVDSVFGNMEIEPEESELWLDSVVSQAVMDEAAAPWGEVPVEEDFAEPPAPEPGLPPVPVARPAPPVAFEPPPPAPPERTRSWFVDDVEGAEPLPEALGEDIPDAWGPLEAAESASGWGPPSGDARQSRAPMAPPDRLRELDPFAAPVGAGLDDELGGDPFDSLSVETAAFRPGEADGPLGPRPTRPLSPVTAPLAEARPGPSVRSAPAQVEAEPLDETHPPGRTAAELAPGLSIEEAGWSAFAVDEVVAAASAEWHPSPRAAASSETPAAREANATATATATSGTPLADPETVAAARRLLARRSSERLAEAFGDVGSSDHVAVEEVLADGDDRRVTRTEYTSVVELEIAHETGPGGDVDGPGVADAPSEGPRSGRRSALAALSAEPLEFDVAAAPARGDDDVRRPSARSGGAPDDTFVFEIRDSRPSAAGPGKDVPDPWAPPDDPGSSIAPVRPAPPPDRLALDRMGAPLLAVVPAFAPFAVEGGFPPGSLGLRELSHPAGPAIVPDLALPDPFDLDAPAHRLLATLQAEVLACDDRRRLALLLHAFGRVAADFASAPELAPAAFRGAIANDPSLAIARWAVLEDLDDAGDAEGLVVRLARTVAGATPDPDALYRAGHVAAARLQDPARALGLWQRAAESGASAPGPQLARYGVLLSQLDWEGADSALAGLAGQVGPVLGTLVALDRLRLADELNLPDAAQRVLIRAAQERMPGTPAVQAALERFAATFGDMELLLSGLRGHFDAVSTDFQRGLLSESAAKRAVGEIFYKAAWALERLGRRVDALREYQNALQSLPNDPYLLHRAGELARRLGRADEHRAHLERVAALARDPAEAANALYQMGLIAQTVLADETLAARDFERALATLPTFTPALAALGRQAIRQGRHVDVRQRFEAEIAQLEEALGGEQAVEVRTRTIRGLVTRYYRVARVLESQLADPETALFYHKRALGLAPSFLPAFLAIERAYEQSGRWRELVALYRGLLERAGPEALDPAFALARAADVLRTRLGDDLNAARAYARVLALRPDDVRTLERSAEVFGRLGNRAALVEVELRRAAVAPHRRQQARHLLRAAQMQSFDGDPLLAAAEALPMFRAAWDAEPGSPGAFDGLLRSAAVLGRAAEIGHVAARLADCPPLEPVLLAQAADALLSAGRAEDAVAVIDAWQQDRRDQDAVTPLRVLVLERSQSWRALVDALEDLVGTTADARRRASLLTRIGELQEFRLREPDLALDAYRRALALDPAAVGARDGTLRLEVQPHESLLSVGTRSMVSGLAAARDAALRGNVLQMAGHVERLARHALDERAAFAVSRISQGAAADDALIRRSFEEAPERLDRFEAWMARLSGPDRLTERVDALRRRLPFEHPGEQPALLASLLSACERCGDEAGVRETAEKLLALDPASLVAALALRRLARRTDTSLAAFEAGERLAGLLQTATVAAAVYRSLADEAGAHEVGLVRARALLEQAVSLDPADREAGAALEQCLRDEQDWGELLGLYNRRIVAGISPDDARELHLRKARLLGGPLEQPDEAVATLRSFVEQYSDDASGVLDAALYARDLAAHDWALQWLELAAAADDLEVAAEAAVVRARLLRDFGDAAGARAELERLLRRVPEHMPALELLAELLAAAREWQTVVKLLRRLFELETAPSRRAERAVGIGEILARVKGDPRAAAGWFKRAVELAPETLHAVWRMLEEADRLPPGEVPVEHLMDAVDRALADVRERLATEPFHAERLRGYAGLQLRRQAWDAAFLARSALELMGEADAAERAFLAQRRARLVVDFAAALTPAQRQQHLLHEGEQGTTGALFEVFALVLSDLLAERPPAGATRLSGRSFSRWQTDFSQIARGLGVEDIELWQIGQAPARLTGAYLPSPALIVGSDVLGSAVDASLAFRLGHLVEGLQGGRLLFDRNGPERLATAIRWMLDVVVPDSAERVVPGPSLGAELQARIVDRAGRLPRRLVSTLEGRLRSGETTTLDFEAFSSAVAETRARAGFLACGDLGVALESVRAMAAGQFDTRNIRTLAPARALLVWSLGPSALALRKALGVAVQR
jgi:tetratricopeptide (TPR) repeat protein